MRYMVVKQPYNADGHIVSLKSWHLEGISVKLCARPVRVR